jgi:hypothetical protein
MVTNRHSSVATNTRGKNTIAKAKAICKSLETECVPVILFSDSSSLQAMLFEAAIALILTRNIYIGIAAD